MSVQHLSNLDLLSTLVGKDAAYQMMTQAGSDLVRVLKEAEHHFTRSASGEYRPHPLAAAVELVQRSMGEIIRRENYLANPRELRSYLKFRFCDLKHEEFHVVLLDARNCVIAVENLFRGTTTKTTVYPRDVVKLAVDTAAVSVVLAHNHPSGSEEPSQTDIELTHRLMEALALVDIGVADHIIIAGANVFSFLDKGLLYRAADLQY